MRYLALILSFIITPPFAFARNGQTAGPNTKYPQPIQGEDLPPERQVVQDRVLVIQWTVEGVYFRRGIQYQDGSFTVSFPNKSWDDIATDPALEKALKQSIESGWWVEVLR